MKKINFEKIDSVVTKEELKKLKGGVPPPGDGTTDSVGDTYFSNCNCYQYDWGTGCQKDCKTR